MLKMVWFQLDLGWFSINVGPPLQLLYVHYQNTVYLLWFLYLFIISDFYLSHIISHHSVKRHHCCLCCFFHHPVFHPVECSYCRSESMMGFRYRCQQCHGYQLCQSCFWRGHANGPHSNQHQMKEHSSWVRQRPNLSQSYVLRFSPFPSNSRVSEHDFITVIHMCNGTLFSFVSTFPVQLGFYGVLLIWQIKLYWLLHPPKSSIVKIWNKRSYRRWIPNPISISICLWKTNDCSKTTGSGGNVFETEIIVWIMKSINDVTD